MHLHDAHVAAKQVVENEIKQSGSELPTPEEKQRKIEDAVESIFIDTMVQLFLNNFNEISRIKNKQNKKHYLKKSESIIIPIFKDTNLLMKYTIKHIINL